jgi:drug/metabolite transporter (DMT)-like permease
MHTQNRLYAIIFVLLSCLFNACMAAAVKLVSSSSNNDLTVFLSRFFSLAIILPYIFLRPKHYPIKSTLKTKVVAPHIIRLISATASLYTYYYAIKTISLSNAILLIYTAPLFIPIVIWIWKGIPILPKLWIGLLTGFMGVVLIIKPTHGILNIGLLAGLASGILSSISYTSVRILTYTEPPIRINFYFYFFATVITAFAAIPSYSMVYNFNLNTWILFFLIGAFGCLYQGLLALASKYGEARFISSFMYSSVVFAMFIEWLLFATIPNVISVLGLILVFLGASLAAYFYPTQPKTPTVE